jgi:tRNA(Leu) C34 or U34 (ribose-2'-O)-methylase TrmL
VPSSKKVARYGRLKAPTGDPEVDFDCATTAFADLLALGLTAVAVEVSDEATPLPSFTHPERALYVFGPEDGTLSKQILAQCAATVLIPTQRCLNLAAAVNIVLYDRCSRLSAP